MQFKRHTLDRRATGSFFYLVIEGILLLTFVYVLGLLASVWWQLAATF
ncbi:MAG: hypothetical protein IMX00_06450 [Limnochordales bacterium]|nr:hypothetical protein [Limnochordales bacterium]